MSYISPNRYSKQAVEKYPKLRMGGNLHEFEVWEVSNPKMWVQGFQTPARRRPLTKRN